MVHTSIFIIIIKLVKSMSWGHDILLSASCLGESDISIYTQEKWQSELVFAPSVSIYSGLRNRMYALFTEIKFSIYLYQNQDREDKLTIEQCVHCIALQAAGFNNRIYPNLSVCRNASTASNQCVQSLFILSLLGIHYPLFLLVKFNERKITAKLSILLVLSIENSHWSECTNIFFLCPNSSKSRSDNRFILNVNWGNDLSQVTWTWVTFPTL